MLARITHAHRVVPGHWGSSWAVEDECALRVVLCMLCRYYLFILLIKCRLPYLSPKYITAADLGVTLIMCVFISCMILFYIPWPHINSCIPNR